MKQHDIVKRKSDARSTSKGHREINWVAVPKRFIQAIQTNVAAWRKQPPEASSSLGQSQAGDPGK